MRVNMGREGRASSSLSANGGTMLGSLILANGPSQPLEAATKYYVDTVFASLNANNILEGILPISSLPAFTGDAINSQGSNSFLLTNIGVNPGSYAKVIVDAKGRVTGNDVLIGSDIPNFDWSKVSNKPSTIADYGITDALSTNGGTVTEHLSVSNPTQPMSAVNKQYVDSALSGNSAVVGDIIRKPYSTTPSGFLRCNGGQADKTLYPELYAAIGDTYSVNTTKGAGRPWEQQYDFNTYQTENIGPWSVNSQGLPYGCLYHQCVVTRNRVYLIGGGDGSGRFSTVYTAQLQSDGVLGTWSVASSLPGQFAYFTAFVVKNRLYVLAGGTTAISYTNTVYTTVINADGTINNWTTAASLPVALSSAHSVVIKNRVWLMGGYGASGTVNTIYYATINSDGTLGTWTLYNLTLPYAVSSGQVAVTKNRVYIIGGSSSIGFLNTIISCPINLDGTLGSWVSSGTYPSGVAVAGCVVTKGCVYIIGGAVATDTYTGTCWKSNINLDGTLGSWERMSDLNYVMGYSSVIVAKNKIYVMGGYLNNGVSSTVMVAQFNNISQDYSEYYSDSTTVNYLMPGSGKPWQQQYQTNNAQSGVISGWSAASSLPSIRGNAQAIVTKNRVYMIGGTSVSTDVVHTAPINPDGTLGAWATDIPIPVAVGCPQVVVTKNYAYILGGYNSTPLSTVYRAPINSDGSLGIWTTDTALPGTMGYSQALVTKNRVYLIGGFNGAWLSTVYTAPINTDGTIGTWVTTTSLPAAVGAASIAVTKNRVYLIGGWTGGGASSTVYTATINSDGYLGPWVTSTSLPAALGYTSTFVCANKVYVVGGYNGAGVSSVYTSDIAGDGTLGTWSASTPLSAGFSHSTVVVTSSKIYLIGGYDTSYSGSVYQADVSGGLNDYSAYYDGSIIPADVPDTSMYFTLPDFTSKENNGSYLFMKY